MHYIYSITNYLTGEVYIGQTTNISSRFSAHRCSLRDNRHANPYLQKSYNKYRKLSFVYIVLNQYTTYESSNYAEIQEINRLKESGVSVFNLRSGGKNDNLSEEHKRKIGTSNKGKTRSEEQKKRISESKMGNKQTDEAIKKRVEARSGYKHSEETKKKMSIASLGKPKSDQARENMSIAHRHKLDITDEDLLELLKTHKVSQVAEMYGVSNDLIYLRRWRYNKRNGYT